MATIRSRRLPIELRPDDDSTEYISEDEEDWSEEGEQSMLSRPRTRGGARAYEEEFDNGGAENRDDANDREGADDIDDHAAVTDTLFSNEQGDHYADISFGALAKAAASFVAPSKTKKRKLSDMEDRGNTQTQGRGAMLETPKHGQSPKQSRQRTSKHAPAVLSTKYRVSRKRDLFDPTSSIKARDPRFDPTIIGPSRSSQSVHQASRNYSFLTQYQASEILELKARMKKSKNETEKAELKRQAMSLEAKVRNTETRRREAEIRQAHKKTEKEAIRQGKKQSAYFLKPSEVRKQLEDERAKSMGKRARDKMEKRRQKRQKGKEARDLPRYRRIAAVS